MSIIIAGEENTPDISTENFVAESQISTLIVAANSDRMKVIIINESSKDLFIKYISPAIRPEGIKLKRNDIWIEETYTGAIYGIWRNGANKGARIIEITK